MSNPVSTIYVDAAAGAQWIVCSEHPGEMLGRFPSKDAAIKAARRIARDRCGQLVVRRGDETGIEFAEDFASVER